MKRLFLVLSLLIIASAPSFSQTESDETTVASKSKLSTILEKYDQFKDFKSFETKNNSLVLNPLAYIGFGELHLDTAFTEDFGASHEWFVNVLSLTLNMSESLSIQTGFDIKSTTIAANDDCLLEADDNEPGRVRFRDPVENLFPNSKVRVLSYAVPLTLGMTFNKRGAFPLTLRGGCEFSFNRPGTIIAEPDFKGKKVTKNWATVDEFAINYIASVSMGSVGIFFKYFPENLLTDIGNSRDRNDKDKVYLSKNYSSIGIMLSF
ncbi:MAG: hypothetical protein J6X57_02285 [Bacteroidales bacterium]|nr:hypothetical protein [Bacteroidales bacterium]